MVLVALLLLVSALMAGEARASHWVDEGDPPAPLPPSITAVVSPTAPLLSWGWLRGVPTVQLIGTGVGFDGGETADALQIQYQWDATSDIAWTAYSAPVNALFGRHDLYYRGINATGDVMVEVSNVRVKRDDLAPAAKSTTRSVVWAKNAWTNSTVKLRHWGWDQSTGSGVKAYSVKMASRNNSGALSSYSRVYLGSVATADISVKPHLTYYFRTRAQDRAGNWGAWSDYVKVAVRSPGGWEFPVLGTYWYMDTWGAARSGGRTHQGTDIFAKKGTKIVAVTDGVASKRWSTLGGRTVWLTGADGRCYYYAHLNSYGTLGQVKVGTVIGYVGNSGNARTTPSHLHFQIHPGCGDPVNPYWYLRRWE